MRRLLLVAAGLLGAVAASKPPLDTLGIPPQGSSGSPPSRFLPLCPSLDAAFDRSVVAGADEAYYKGGVIKCRDGSGRFTRDKLNDDFCDCPDGTDEPGNPFILLWGCSSEWTSACPEGKFYCKNAGHTPITIFSSRVNDGICGKRIGCSNSVPSYLLDCCDGSDEYDNVTCKNTCWEAGKAAREKLKKKVATYKSGVVIRKQEVEKAKEAYAKDEVELAKLKGEEKILQGLVDKLKGKIFATIGLQSAKETYREGREEEERLRKEKEEKRIKEEADKLAAAAEKKATDSSQPVDSKETNEHVKQDESKVADQHELATEHDDHVPESETSVEQHGSESQDDGSIEAVTVHDTAAKESAASTEEQDPSADNPEGLSREELGRLVASRWTGENVNDVNKDDKKGHEDEPEIPEPAEEALENELEVPEPAEENYGGYHSEIEDDRHKYDDEDFDHESEDEYVSDHDEHVHSYKSDDDQKHDQPSDLTTSGKASWMDRVQQTVQNVLQKFNFFKTPVDLSEASRVRKEYDDASSKLSKIQSKISTLTEKLKHDFGKCRLNLCSLCMWCFS
ncbi:hypothetical protein PR202_ga24020 [Eleusine coracana subsp. coracana]|uniref:Glucosidase II beta subunit N-terminal domain-containing protein n=1 Tax=Eleusine coracana subsp. coracana TaxID=191504 RepID=A0AAV5D7P6_ELECO|nr:hypothetical protein PR202_ga24020 [Eleusine coracana subsp. coracana]